MVSTSDGSLKVLKTVTWENPNPLFSPDGKFIAYDLPTEQDRQQRDIYLLATDGSRETVLVEHPANEFLLGWSGNGDRIFFSSDRTGATGAWVAGLGPQSHRVHVSPWSEVGRAIAKGAVGIRTPDAQGIAIGQLAVPATVFT